MKFTLLTFTLLATTLAMPSPELDTTAVDMEAQGKCTLAWCMPLAHQCTSEADKITVLCLKCDQCCSKKCKKGTKICA
jgi:hypothetical protein